MSVNDKQFDRALKRIGDLEALGGRVVRLEERMAEAEARITTTKVPIRPHKVSVKCKCGHTINTGCSLEPDSPEEAAALEAMAANLCPDCQTRIEQKERIAVGRRIAEGAEDPDALTTQG